MKILTTVNDVIAFMQIQHGRNASVGLVPTMGALHDGHLSLVERAVAENDVVVVSIFVNPAQFNNPEDLKTYPRKEEDDLKLLAGKGVSAVFMPLVEEIYPEGHDPDTAKKYDLGQAEKVMEGKFRPGHFQGVATIVDKLFRIVNPTRAYFGEKDFQQIAVIRNMIESEGLKVEIVACPIKREESGLALSSRNALLDETQKAEAAKIYDALRKSVEFSKTHTVKETHDYVVELIDAVASLKTEYYEIVDARTLAPIDEWNESPWIVGCVAVYCGPTRLIDNITYRLPN